MIVAPRLFVAFLALLAAVFSTQAAGIPNYAAANLVLGQTLFTTNTSPSPGRAGGTKNSHRRRNRCRFRQGFRRRRGRQSRASLFQPDKPRQRRKPEIVIGQVNFSDSAPNQGLPGPSQTSLSDPGDIFLDAAGKVVGRGHGQQSRAYVRKRLRALQHAFCRPRLRPAGFRHRHRGPRHQQDGCSGRPSAWIPPESCGSPTPAVIACWPSRTRLRGPMARMPIACSARRTSCRTARAPRRTSFSTRKASPPTLQRVGGRHKQQPRAAVSEFSQHQWRARQPGSGPGQLHHVHPGDLCDRADPAHGSFH